MMVPVLSSRVFGRLPDARELVLARRFWFLHLQLHLSRPLPSERDQRLFEAALGAAGLQVPCVHLPVAGDDAAALDFAQRLGARIAVWHPTDEAGLEYVAARALDHGMRLAVETDTSPGSDLAAVRALLARSGAAAEGHRICLDASRRRPTVADAMDLRSDVRWVEVSRPGAAHAHLPPQPDDQALYDVLGALSPPYLAYEVELQAPGARPPGEAELSNLLARLNAWHRGGGVTRWRAPVTDVPIG